MIAFVYYPLYLIIFWYKDVLGGLLRFFTAFNSYISSLLSLPVMVRTFFKPLKNEYRDGLVIFSIVFGMILKAVLIGVSLIAMLLIFFIEFFVGLLLSVLPFVLFLFIFIKKLP